MKRAIILFTRVPVPGATKTRLMPHFTPRQCAALHRCFLEDIAEQCRNCRADLFISYTPEKEKYRLVRLLGEELPYIPQEGETLGERMFHAFEEILGRGYTSCLLIGADVPEVRSAHLERAFAALEEKDVVFGRTRDGGYYLVGMRRARKEVFSLDAYGHARVLADTVEKLEQEGVTVGYTETLCDMDTPEDLEGYCGRMRESLWRKESRTGRYLARNRKISIIVPIYNEARTIEHLLGQLRPLLNRCEVILVDGGSVDGTVEKIGPEFTLLTTDKGRAAQMNLGARNSSGDILFFLHCDSELPAHPLERIRKVMRDCEAGCFGVAFHSRNFFMFTCRVISNHRIRDRKVMFGDQGIFLDRELFFRAGMFPEIPIMEDYQFSLTLKEMGVRLGMADRRIYTSDRRFPDGTIPKLKLMWKMNRLRKMYRDGVPIERIASLYRDVR